MKLLLNGKTALELTEGMNIFQIAKAAQFPEKIIAAKFNGEIIDASTTITQSGNLDFITTASPEALGILNHSTAHLMAEAIKSLFPSVQFGVGPAIEEGFYYDFLLDTPLKEEHLKVIEDKMKVLAKEAQHIKRSVVTKKEALDLFKHDKFKKELINEATGEIIIRSQGNFVDLCRGVHLPDTSYIKHFKLLTIAGSYWRGNSQNESMQRIYGIAFYDKVALENHLLLLEERKQRDHRRIGKEMKLFMFSPLAGQGMPIWLPHGTIICQQLQNYIVKMERKYRFQHVMTPAIGSVELYKTSGHWSHYKEDMFPVMETENEQLVLRPMSCPHHVLIYRNDLRSYRDLPLRLAEQVLQHRLEASGALTGMERVRAMNLTDSHIFCTLEQVRDEFSHALKLILEVLKDLNIVVDYYRLSLHDKNNKEKYFNDPEMWSKSEDMLRSVLRENKVDFIEAAGEAAFYGPKLDIQVKTILGHDITLSTLQLDFLLPERFDLTYVDETGGKSRPVMIHRGLIGTYERFLAILIEQYKGIFPTWLAPVQVRILPVIDKHAEFVKELEEQFFDLDIRAEADSRNEKLGYRLRDAQINKIPYTIVIGDKEMENGLVTYRQYGSEAQVTVSIAEFVQLIKNDIAKKSQK